jgi:adenine-specific DNA methylase
MIPHDCKRLAEVDFPIAAVSKQAAREKSIRHGHPSTLHLWWARRPLASCRAILLTLLLPDPSDALCPVEFKRKAREILRPVPGRVGETDQELRAALLRFIGDFADWDHASNATFLETGRQLIKAAQSNEIPLIVDPFAGGGSIPLEALRLGCDAFASDLNPISCMILKTMLEDIPRFDGSLAKELRRVGGEIKQQVERELFKLYPRDSDGSTPVAYLWARTVQCESPSCGAEIPLLRSLWLCKRANHRRALRTVIRRSTKSLPTIDFQIVQPQRESEVEKGTVRRAKATCPACNYVLAPERLRAQLSQHKGGTDVVFDEKGRRIGGARLVAVVTTKPGQPGWHYRIPNSEDYVCIRDAHLATEARLQDWKKSGQQGLPPFPHEPVGRVPVPFGVINVWVYGMSQWSHLYTKRQQLVLQKLCELVSQVPSNHSDALRAALAMVLGRCADYSSSGVVWAQSGEFVAHTFGRQALPFVWDFAEPVLSADTSGNLEGAIDWVARVIEAWPGSEPGSVQSADAAAHTLPDEVASVWFTDPPYYDSVPYSYLSDYFYVWLKRALPRQFSEELTPKKNEIVAYVDSSKNGKIPYEVYEERMGLAFSEGRRILRANGIGAVVFAHKTTEGWEALLSGLVHGRWTITASWPIATERPGRLRSQNSAALGSSIHLICRPRPDTAEIGDWAEVLRELPSRVADWMARLESEGVRGADLVFACIGPALEIFSRYSRVETADGREVPLGGDPEARDPAKRGYLAYVWEVVGRAALQQVLGTAEAQARTAVQARLKKIRV